MNLSVQEALLQELTDRGLTMSTAESCTGGGVAARMTSLPGSSACFKGGVVAYSNEVKMDVLRVSENTLNNFGAVSEQTVMEMVKGAMKTLKTDCAIATSGIAGPGGGSLEKPVGTIWMAVACGKRIRTYRQEGDEGRAKNIERTINTVLNLLLQLVKEEK